MGLVFELHALQEEIGTGSQTIASCKTLCKLRPQCTHIALESSTCYEYGYTGADISDYSDVETWARYPSCGERSTCLNLTIANFHYLSGEYCPYGESAFANGQVFLKLGRTEQDSFWLVKNDDASLTGCAQRTWVLRATDPDLDFWNASSNHVEHRGSIAACFNAKDLVDLVDLVTGVHLSSPLDLQDMVIVGTVESAAANAALVMPSCGTPNVTMAGKVQASEAGSETTLGSGLLILDDPATSQIVEDYWLHPCQCVPPDWDGAPVTPDAIADIPPDSNNQFLAPPFEIVSGAFVCAQEFLLQIHHTENDPSGESLLPDLDEGSCRTLCAEDRSCLFFWAGTVGASKQCWTYSGCGTLYRQVGLQGRLMAWPKKTQVCRIADATQCWHVTKRRQFLKASIESIVRPLPPCLYQSLFEQCDQKLMLGGTSVEACGQCKFAELKSAFDPSGAPLVTSEKFLRENGINDNSLSVLPFNASTPDLLDYDADDNLRFQVFFGSSIEWGSGPGSADRTNFDLMNLPWLYGSNCYYIKGEKGALPTVAESVHMTIHVPWNAVVYLAFYDEDASASYGFPDWEDFGEWQYWINTSNFVPDKTWDAMWFYRYLEAGEELKLYGNGHPCAADETISCGNLWPYLPFVCPHVNKPIATTEVYVECDDNIAAGEINRCINNNSFSVLPFNSSTPTLRVGEGENRDVYFNTGLDWSNSRIPDIYGSDCYYIKGHKNHRGLPSDRVHMTIRTPWNAVAYLIFLSLEGPTSGFQDWPGYLEWRFFKEDVAAFTGGDRTTWFFRYLEAGQELNVYGNDKYYLTFVCPLDSSAAESALPKKSMPLEFQHGTAVVATCWDERYSATSDSSSEIRCVAGAWINSNGGRGLGNFECLSLHDRGRCPVQPSHRRKFK